VYAFFTCLYRSRHGSTHWRYDNQPCCCRNCCHGSPRDPVCDAVLFALASRELMHHGSHSGSNGSLPRQDGGSGRVIPGEGQRKGGSELKTHQPPARRSRSTSRTCRPCRPLTAPPAAPEPLPRDSPPGMWHPPAHPPPPPAASRWRRPAARCPPLAPRPALCAVRQRRSAAPLMMMPPPYAPAAPAPPDKTAEAAAAAARLRTGPVRQGNVAKAVVG